MAITQKGLVRISSNFLCSIRTSICIRICNKNLSKIFLKEICCTILQHVLSNFGATFNFNEFDWNQLKLPTQHKNYKNELLAIFDKLKIQINLVVHIA